MSILPNFICTKHNPSYGIPWDCEIKTDHQIPARRPHRVSTKITSSRSQSENQRKRKKIDKYSDLERKQKKAIKHTGDGGAYCSWCSWSASQSLGEGTGGTGNQWKNQNHSDYSNIEISKNTEESPGELRRLAITLIPMNDHQQTLV